MCSELVDYVEKSSLRVLGSNSKFNENKSKRASGKQRDIKIAENSCQKKKKFIMKIVRVNNNCDIINLKISRVCHVITRTQSSPIKRGYNQ